MSPYIEWNRLLLTHFFSPAIRKEETWLATSKAELDTIGLSLGGAEGLIAAVREGPPWLLGYNNIAEAACRLARQRKNTHHSNTYIDPEASDNIYLGQFAPTYLPYLALWVMASAESVDGFYVAVQKMSNLSFSSNNQSIRNDMDYVWRDLEAWTQGNNGAFGYFFVRALGDHHYVGMPRSQCLISPKDKRGLPLLFSGCGLRPKQQLNGSKYSQFVTFAANAHYISNSLRAAFHNSDYDEPLRRMLNAALSSWDGKVPKTRLAGVGVDKQNLSIEAVFEEVALTLRPSQSIDKDWDIHWRIPSTGYEEELSLSAEGVCWRALIEEMGTHATSVSDTYENACHILSKVINMDIEFTAKFIQAGDENGISIKKYILPKRTIRTLVWDAPDPRYGQELIEGDIPLTGPCYLVYHEQHDPLINRVLDSCSAKWEPMQHSGLPEDWRIGCIAQSEILSIEQRRLISDSDFINYEKARIRLVGGRPILRGGGKVYAYYDLPLIEVEAPPSALIQSEGLEISEYGTNQFCNDMPTKIKRYVFQIEDKKRAVFQIHVVETGNIIATTTLKVSVSYGTAMAKGRNFGLCQLGRPSINGEKIVGVLHDEQGAALSGNPPLNYFDDSRKGWRPINDSNNLLQIYESITTKFLDSLAQLGSMPFGAARDQLKRLSHQTKINISPALFLMEMRSRGYLEIESDNHGHLIRVHNVPPTIYTLPVSRNGYVVRVLCGSLRMQIWADICNYLNGEVLIETSQQNVLSVSLITFDENNFKEFLEDVGIINAVMPASRIADWAKGINDAKTSLSSWSWENLATEFRHLQRFNSGSAEFKSQNLQRIFVDPSVGIDLYRFEDPIVPALQSYVMGSLKENGQQQFSYLEDSRWGIWLTINSFAKYLHREFNRDDVLPWPIHYSPITGSFWLPARMRPPIVIERILTLCSGTTPLQVQNGFGITALINNTSNVYTQMVNGVWLEYRWIPNEIATKVAGLLGGAVRDL